MFDIDDLVGRDAPVLRPNEVALEPALRDQLIRQRNEGWLLFIHAWRPQIARNETTASEVDACFAEMRQLLGDDVDVACCPHDAGPPVCWCRKPIPGSVIELARRRQVALSQSIVVGSSAADRTLAERIGARFETSADFFQSVGERPSD